VKRIEQLLGMPVVSVSDGVRLGRVDGVQLDPADGRILYLQYKGDHKHQDGVIPWKGIRSIGADAVTVDGAASVLKTVPDIDVERLTPYVGDRPVMTASGTRLGTVSSYEIDELTGRVERYHIATGGLLGRLTHSEVVFPHSAIRAFGKDAIVVDDAVGATPRD